MYNANLLRGLLIVATLALFSFNTGANQSGGKPSLYPPAEGIQFIEEDWKEALKEAGKQNKLIFLDAYTSWCGPCKLLKRNTFPDKNAGEFFNKNFINVAVNMEKGYGPLLSGQYFVTAYPTLIVTDANGNLVAYTRGYIKPKQLIEFGRYALSRKNKIK